MINRRSNADLRQTNLGYIPAHYHKEIYDLERDYGKYCYVPLAVPVINDERIVDWFNQHRQAIIKMKPDIADQNFGYSLFNSINVCLDDRYLAKNPIWSDNQYPNFKQDFPHFYQQMMDCLPLAQIPRFSFWNSTRPIEPHRDHSYLVDMPNSFRIMIYDENPIETLYVYENADDYNGDKKYVDRLAETNSFVWNNLRVEHGSDYLSGYSKILLLINDFIPNYKKYREVMEKSISTYRDHLVVSAHQLEDFI
jgi:hypothetical protein